MVFRKRKTRRFGTKRRTTLARKVKRITRIVRSLKPEVKYFDSSVTNSSLTANGFIYPLNNVVQSTSASNDITRIGDIITNKLLHFRARVLCNGNSASASDMVRLILFWGKSEQGTFPVPSLLLNSSTLGGFIAPLSMQSYDYRRDITVIKDQTHQLPGESLTQGIPLEWEINWKVPLKHKTNFIAATTNMSDHGLYLLAVGDSTSNMPQMDYVARVTFTDS